MSLMSLNDPTKSTALLNYDLDSFRNSIWENFMGSMVEYKKLVDINGNITITDKKAQKMGFVQLRVHHQSLYHAWDNNLRSEIDGFKAEKPG
jgi:hypothetical protein